MDQALSAPTVAVRPARPARWLAAAASLLLAAIVALHAALIPGGRWDGDEYFNFALLRDLGWRFAWQRLYSWSLRPASEAVLWLYDGAVTLTGAPLVAPFLALLWALLLGGGVLALWQPRLPGAPWRLAAAWGVAAAFLLGHPVNEMFYWPMAAAPYLLALTGIAGLCYRLIAGRTATPRGRILCASALLLAAGSAEIGLFFALGCAGLLLLADLPALRRRPRATLAAGRWYLLPLLFALALLGAMLRLRVGDTATGLTADPAYFHRGLPSLTGALAMLPAEFAGRDPFRPGPGPLGFLAGDALLFAGLFACLRAGLPKPVPRRHLLALAGGIALAMVGSMTAALFQYGLLCCERHHAFRHCLLALLLLVLAKLAAQAWPAGRRSALWQVAGPLCLLAATLPGLGARLPGLLHDYRLLGTDIAAARQNWALRDPAAPPVFHLPARGAVLEGLTWQPGTYSRDDRANWAPAAMLRYFGRVTGDVVATPAP